MEEDHSKFFLWYQIIQLTNGSFQYSSSLPIDHLSSSMPSECFGSPSQIQEDLRLYGLPSDYQIRTVSEYIQFASAYRDYLNSVESPNPSKIDGLNQWITEAKNQEQRYHASK